MMVIITFYRGHDNLLGEQKLKAGRSSQIHSHKHTCVMTKMRCQIQMISSQSVNQSISWSNAFIQIKYLNDSWMDFHSVLYKQSKSPEDEA